MPNPKANQQPLDLDRIKADAMSMGIPARVLLDMIASGARSAVATTAGLPVDTLNTAIGLHNMAHDIRRRKFEGYEPGTIPGGSEDIKGLIPNPVKDPNSNLNKMADFGGDFAIIPGVGTAAMKGAKMVGQEIADRVATGQKLMPGSFSEPQMAMHVVKPKGGNWLTGDVEKQLGRMKMADLTTPEEMAEMQKSIDTAKRIMGDDPTVQRTVNQMENELSTAKRNNSINNWIDSNLTNYVKKQMGTPEDPVRKLAEENVLHMKPYGDQQSVSSRLMSKRMGAGFDPLGAGKSDAARFWERQADTSIDPYPAGSYKHGALDEKLLEANPWLQNVPDDQMVNYAKGLNDLGFDHIIDVLRQDVREGRIRPEQLNKVSMEQAVRRTYEYDQEMAKKMAEAQFKITEGMPVHKEYPEGYKWIELKMPEAKLPEGHSIVQDYPTKSNWSVVPHPEGSGYGIRADNGQFGSDARGRTERKWNTPEEAKASIPEYAEIQEPYENEIFKIVDPSGKTVSVGATEKEALNLYNRQEREKQLEDALKYEGDTMGHCVGGYCPDVLEGRSRIFSLRDKKGEPHVTIEVQPSKTLTPEKRETQMGYLMQRLLGEGMSEEEALEQANRLYPESETASRIVQIKGKGNARPVSKYDPFTQDFVKSGNWGEIGDLHNTGLVDTTTTTANMEAKKLGLNIPRFMSREESEALGDHLYAHQLEPETNPQVPEILKKYQDQTQPIKHSEDQISVVPKSIDPNPEEYAKGGRVKHKIHVDDDLDMMRHELMIKDGVQRFQVGGLAKGMSKLFSAVDKTAIELQRAKGTGKEFMTELSKKPGVKKAELADRNLHEINELPKMTKDQFKAELDKRPVPKVSKKILSNDAETLRIVKHNPDSIIDDRHWVVDRDNEPVTAHPFPSREDAESHIENHEIDENGTHHEDFKLPGGSNYQEHLYKYEPEGEDPFVANSNHFGGEPNVLASARTVDRKTPDGKKILHVEEIQSDWHQQGREGGYGNQLTPEDAQRVEELERKSANGSISMGERAEWAGLIKKREGAVPDAPFKKNWEEMVSKDLIKHAIDNGYDGIALTNGKDQADRYSLAKNIDALHYNPDTHRLIGKKNGRLLIDEVAVPPEKLESYIGKETAQKVMSQEPNVNGLRSLLGEDLNVGGEGMKAAYDNRIPNIFNDIGKKYDVKTELNGYTIEKPSANNPNNLTLPGQTARPAPTTQLHYMEFTPEMKQEVATEGLPAYADGGQVAQPRHEAFLNPSIKLANGSVTLNPLEFMPNYKKGGKVHVSDDMDMMRHEIHMSGGGSLSKAVLKGVNQFLTKAEKVPALPLKIPRATPKTNQEIDKVATRVSKQMLGEHVKPENSTKTVNLANRSMRENERVKSLPYQIQPTGASQKAEAYEPKIGDVNIAIPGDQTISDSILRHVGDLEDINSVQEGGSRYGLGKMNLENPLFWASSEEPAQMAQDKITRLAGYYSPDRVIGQHMAMGPISNNFAMHLADANLKSTAMHIADGKINPEQMYSFDNIIANGYVKKNAKTGEYEHINFPHWPGVADLEGSYKAMQNDPELRKWYNNRMKTPDVTSAHGLPNGLDIQWAITEPALRNMEVNLTGLSAGKMVPGAELTDTASHNTYAKGIQGLALQPKTPPGAFEILYPDATQYIRETKNPSDFTGTIQKVFPHQLVDDQYLNEVGQYNDFIKKYTGQKKGGTVHMGAGGSLVNKVAEKLGQLALPLAEREANKAKFLEPSEVKDVLYHGTGADIKQFIPSLKTNSTFLSHDPYFASSFAENRSATNNGLPNVMPVHAQIKNPWDYENPDHVKAVVDELNKKKDYFGAPSGMDHEPKLMMGKWSTIENPQIQKIIKELGHDSFYVKEGQKKNIGVYNQNAIKSAIGNRGTYDTTNPDITKAKGGKVHITDNMEMMRHELNRG